MIIVLRQQAYAELVASAAKAELLAERLVESEKRNDKLLDVLLSMRMAGAEVPPGWDQEGFEKYTMDEVEEEAVADEVGPRLTLASPEEEEFDQSVLDDLAQALDLRR